MNQTSGIYLLLGSNRGDRMGLLGEACRLIGEEVGVIVAASRVYASAPWGFEDETAFLNQVVEVDTLLEPEVLLDKLLGIERRLGRVRSSGDGCHMPDLFADPDKPVISTAPVGSGSGYSSRTIDIDILFYGTRIIFTDRLMVPHPRLHLRRFTLVPLAEIAGDFVHPVLRKRVAELLRICPDQGNVLMC